MLNPLILMILGHFVCDYPLQGDFLAKAKNKNTAIPGVPWYQALIAHAGIQALSVYLITGIWWIALLELLCHAFIDNSKCKGWLSFNQDQALHMICKVLWFLLL